MLSSDFIFSNNFIFVVVNFKNNLKHCLLKDSFELL